MTRKLLLALGLLLPLSACAPRTAAATPRDYVLSTTPRAFAPGCTSMTVRTVKDGTLIRTLSGNSSVTLSAANTPGSAAGAVEFRVECLDAGRVTGAGTFQLRVPSFSGTLLHLSSPDFKDDPASAIYEIAQPGADGALLVSVRIDRFR